MLFFSYRHKRQRLKRDDNATLIASKYLRGGKDGELHHGAEVVLHQQIITDEELQKNDVEGLLHQQIITSHEELQNDVDLLLHQQNVTSHEDPQEQETSSLLYDAFLTHNWGLDSEDRDNHNRVVKFKKHLEKKHKMNSLWLDEERMTGHIVKQMSDGIDKSRYVIVFVTQKYIDKVARRGPNGDRVNCRLEFDYAANRKGSSKMIAVVMEDACSNAKDWDGPVGMYLGGQLYFSCTKDSELQTCAEMVYEEIQKRKRVDA